ncbi:hypothetical protein ACIOJ9_28495 [Streptomyces sp. NPDC088175]|uniref:hypothetical protein n=1 Tax=unclassified Streptomyces TaxID=2593676 RepID=UPI003819D5B8
MPRTENTTLTTAVPPGREMCFHCDGNGVERNPYAHECDGPLCQDPDVIQCHLCDGKGTVRREDPDW